MLVFHFRFILSNAKRHENDYSIRYFKHLNLNMSLREEAALCRFTILNITGRREEEAWFCSFVFVFIVLFLENTMFALNI